MGFSFYMLGVFNLPMRQNLKRRRDTRSRREGTRSIFGCQLGSSNLVQVNGV